ncbi:MAG: hypothetical protein E4H36_05860, partial [Spirochaetales bacterium]
MVKNSYIPAGNLSIQDLKSLVVVQDSFFWYRCQVSISGSFMKKFPALMIFLLTFAPFLLSAEPYRGRLQTETEHFLFIYEEKDTDAVRELVTFAENVYTRVTAYFGYHPERVYVIVNGRTDDANGSYSPMPSRLELYISSPSAPLMGTRTANWLEILFTHEFTHWVHLTYGPGFYGSLARVFGELSTAPLGFHIPGWMTEGIAINIETMFTEGGRGRNPFFEIYYKAPVMEGNLFSLWQAAYGSIYPPRGRVWVAGYMIVHYMMETYGENVFAEINHEYAEFPLFGAWSAIHKITGKRMKDIFADMKLFYEDRFAACREIPDGRRITPPGYGNYYLPLAADKGLIAYRSTLKSPPALVLLDPATNGENKLLDVYLFDEYSYTADSAGNTVVFAASETDYASPAGRDSISDLYLFDTASGRVRRLTKGAHLRHPAMSPDGSALAAVQMTGSYSRLVLVDPESGVLSPLYEQDQASMFTPAFSPDGNRLAFVMNLRGMQDIYLLQPGPGAGGPETAGARPVTGTDYAGDYVPRWADNGTILFCSDRSGSLELYTVKTGGMEAGEQEEAVPLLQDPVAAMGGIMYGGDIIYSSYTSRGFTLKAKPFSRGSTAPAGKPPAGGNETPPPVRAWKDIESVKRYIDFPRPVLWVPVPAVTYAGNP